MNWLSNITPPGIKKLLKQEEDSADTLWEKCKNCGEMIFTSDLEAAHRVCSACDFHMALSVEER
ncbi:MAG: acetyl-CoA carboxylase carboxyl transferase subunit beta, partial [Pseudomonadota bacterium]